MTHEELILRKHGHLSVWNTKEGDVNAMLDTGVMMTAWSGKTREDAIRNTYHNIRICLWETIQLIEEFNNANSI